MHVFCSSVVRYERCGRSFFCSLRLLFSRFAVDSLQQETATRLDRRQVLESGSEFWGRSEGERPVASLSLSEKAVFYVAESHTLSQYCRFNIEPHVKTTMLKANAKLACVGVAYKLFFPELGKLSITFKT